MKVSAVLLARAIAFLDINELNPRGGVYFPQLVPAIVDRFNFRVFPSKLEDFDESKGVKFSDGYADGTTVDELIVFSDGIVISLRSSTEHARDMIEKTLTWLSDEHGVTYNEKTVNRWNYISNLAFDSDMDLDLLNPALIAVANRLNDVMTDDIRVTSDFRVSLIQLDVHRVGGTMQLAPFKIERRTKIDFREGKYFAAAPLSTSTHISILEEFENALRTSHIRK